MACAESHLSIYRHALTADPAAPALIFEDEMEIYRPAAEFLRVIDAAPPEWDLSHPRLGSRRLRHQSPRHNSHL